MRKVEGEEAGFVAWAGFGEETRAGEGVNFRRERVLSELRREKLDRGVDGVAGVSLKEGEGGSCFRSVIFSAQLAFYYSWFSK